MDTRGEEDYEESIEDEEENISFIESEEDNTELVLGEEDDQYEVLPIDIDKGVWFVVGLGIVLVAVAAAKKKTRR